jgi:competence ComEA-like helix-hairpin-helix protein
MGIFTTRDRTAIAVISTLILIGWGIRYTARAPASNNEPRLIKSAVEPPLSLSEDTDQAGAPVDINTAPVSRLETLPMIGPVRARAIIEWRSAHGPFRDIGDITRVPGIGPATLESLREHIVVQFDTTDAAGMVTADGDTPVRR